MWMSVAPILPAGSVPRQAPFLLNLRPSADVGLVEVESRARKHLPAVQSGNLPCTNANQYMAPTGPYETVQTVDGESWYKQYAQPTVQRTPYKEESGRSDITNKLLTSCRKFRKERIVPNA